MGLAEDVGVGPRRRVVAEAPDKDCEGEGGGGLGARGAGGGGGGGAKEEEGEEEEVVGGGGCVGEHHATVYCLVYCGCGLSNDEVVVSVAR